MKTSNEISRKRRGARSLPALLLLCAAAFILFEGCVTYKEQKRPYLIQENLKYALKHLQKKRKEEAAQIYQVILFADPHNVEAKLKLGEIGSYRDCFMKPTLIGKSQTPCAKNLPRTGV